MKEPRTNADAHKAKLVAKEVRDLPGSSITDVIVADEMEKLADQKLAVPVPPRRGTGGELMPPLDKLLSGTELAVSEPSMVSVDASIARIDLADRAGVFDLAFDAAETIGAKDAIEQMLAHQMAAAHKSAMTLLARSAAIRDTVEQARLANAATRLMEAYQKAMLALWKVRTGGRQFVTVQHVQVASGGQAVVAAEFNAQGSRDGG
jgi:hypothetical protein